MALNASTPALRHHLARVAAAASMSSSTLNQQLGGLALLQQQYSTTAHDAPQLQLQRLQQAITPQVCADLVSKVRASVTGRAHQWQRAQLCASHTRRTPAQGYAVADGVFGPTVARQLKRELLQVYSRGLMHHNHTHIVARAAGTTQLLPKAHIHEAELTLDPSIQAAAPVIAQLNADTSLATMLSLHIPQLRLEAQAIKLQHNTGARVCLVVFGCGVRRRRWLCGVQALFDQLPPAAAAWRIMCTSQAAGAASRCTLTVMQQWTGGA
jgi:hypothetical protein